ncbi:MAG: hypothetical protein KY396_04600 [Actinobacteria bacterium]|nr:hypothetical protein [Actinomycetota bacterium]
MEARRSRAVEREQWIEQRERDERVVPFAVVVVASIFLGTLMWVAAIYLIGN